MIRLSIVSFAALALSAGIAAAHPNITSGPAAANKTSKITFGISHGCSGADTVKFQVNIPTGITSVRPLPSDIFKMTVVRNGTAVTSVTWTKTDAEPDDFAFYELTLRARVADVPFTKIQFNVIQTCRDANGVETIVPWDQPPGSTTGEPAPLLTVVPARIPGWNKFTIGAAGVLVADLPTYFGDAVIVWRGTSAYSSNATTATQIGATTGVTALASDLVTGDEILVRY